MSELAPKPLCQRLVTRIERIVSAWRERLENRFTLSTLRMFRWLRSRFPNWGNLVLAELVEKDIGLPLLYQDSFGARYLLYPSDRCINFLLQTGSPIDCTKSLKFIFDYLKPGMSFVDVGANIGVHTLIAVSKTRDGRFFAIEPESSNYSRLCENLRLNGASFVLPIRAAAFSNSGEIELNVFGSENYGHHSLGIPIGLPVQRVRTEKVPAICLDEFAEHHHLERIDFLKIDVEGAELSVLEGAKNLFSTRSVGCLLFEISTPMLRGMNVEAESIFEFLLRSNYIVHEVTEQGTLGRVVSRANSSYENYVALPG